VIAACCSAAPLLRRSTQLDLSLHKLRYITSKLSKGFPKDESQPTKKTWMIMIHNSMVCLRVQYCVQLLPEVFFLNILFTFSFSIFFIFSISFFYLEFSEMPNFPKYMMPYENPIKKHDSNNFSRG
jgi:hypothetical protein